MPAGGIIMWSGTIATIPTGWYLCDGNNGTPNLVDRFIVGAKEDDGGTAKTNVTGSLTQSGDGQNIEHSHGAGTLAGTAANAGSHTHQIEIRTTGDHSTGHGSSRNTTGSYSNISAGMRNATAPDHSHTVSISSGSSATSGTGTKNIAVYYALAFIMKS